MALVLEVTSDHKDLLDDGCCRTFDADGGTIGRGLQNDWILPDPDRYISGRHATIDCRSGSWYLVDVSSNGVYVNEALEPLGKGNTRRLFDGDRLRMGDWEFLVHIDEGEEIDVPEPDLSSSMPVDFDQRIPAEEPKSGIMLLDEEALTGNEAFQAAVFGSVDEPVLEVEEPPETSGVAPPSAAGASADGEQLYRAFLEGIGISPAELHPATDREEVMRNAGELFRELVEAMGGLLHSRTHVKSLFRLDQTTMLPRRNNPLKLAGNVGDLLKQLLVGREGEYLAPLDAVREAGRDLRHHQDAVITAMAAAVRDFLDRLDPVELTDHFDQTLPRRPLLDWLNRYKYWQMYSDLYPIITQPGSGPFPQQLGEDFVRYYEKEIADHKRHEDVGQGNGTLKIRTLRAEAAPLGDTQRLDRSLDDVVADEHGDADESAAGPADEIAEG